MDDVKRFSREREAQGPRLFRFTDEDWTLGGCACASCCVAEVDRRRLAQKSVIGIHSNRVPPARGRGLVGKEQSSTGSNQSSRALCARRNAEKRSMVAKPCDRGMVAPERGVGDGPRAQGAITYRGKALRVVETTIPSRGKWRKRPWHRRRLLCSRKRRR